jgi:hypothetical protein
VYLPDVLIALSADWLAWQATDLATGSVHWHVALLALAGAQTRPISYKTGISCRNQDEYDDDDGPGGNGAPCP